MTPPSQDSALTALERARQAQERQERKNWIVLGDREHGISWGPFTKAEALRFEGGLPGRMALPFDAACSQIETCVAFGLPYKPRKP